MFLLVGKFPADRPDAGLGDEVYKPVKRKWDSSRRKQRGEGRLKALVYLAFLVVAVFVAIKVVPLYVADYQLKDKMTEQAKFAIVNRYTRRSDQGQYLPYDPGFGHSREA